MSRCPKLFALLSSPLLLFFLGFNFPLSFWRLLWLLFGSWGIFFLWLLFGRFFALWYVPALVVHLLFTMLEVWVGLFYFFFCSVESIVRVWIRLEHSEGVLIVALEFFLLFLSEFCLAGFLFLPAPLLFFFESNFLQALFFLGLCPSFFLAIEVQAIDLAFSDKDLSLTYITS